MNRMNLQLRNALKATLMRVAALHPGIAKIEYFMILKNEHLRYFRDKAFNKL